MVLILFILLKNNNPGNDVALFYSFFCLCCLFLCVGFCATCKPGIRKLLKSTEVLVKYENEWFSKSATCVVP